MAGRPSLVCIILFLSGIRLLFLELSGEYLSKACMEIGRLSFLQKVSAPEHAIFYIIGIQKAIQERTGKQPGDIVE